MRFIILTCKNTAQDKTTRLLALVITLTAATQNPFSDHILQNHSRCCSQKQCLSKL